MKPEWFGQRATGRSASSVVAQRWTVCLQATEETLPAALSQFVYPLVKIPLGQFGKYFSVNWIGYFVRNRLEFEGDYIFDSVQGTKLVAGAPTQVFEPATIVPLGSILAGIAGLARRRGLWSHKMSPAEAHSLKEHELVS